MMADFAKRAEVTIETMGKVNNPTGSGVRATSSQVQAKKKKQLEAALSSSGSDNDKPALPESITTTSNVSDHLTTGTSEGSSRRNIQRKHTADTNHRYDSTHKKQGGHGKGLWKHHSGLEDAEKGDYFYDEPNIVLDEKDPLYIASEDSTQYVLTSNETVPTDNLIRGRDPGTQRVVYGPLLTLTEFKIQVADCLTEYLQDSNDADEVIRRLQELGCNEYHAQVLVKKIVSLSLDMGPRQREWASRLLTCLHPVPMSLDDLQVGFQVLLDGMEDLSKDVPDAVNLVACFLARAVVDEVLPPAFLSQENNERPGDPVIARAISLLNREHSTARLEKIWGPGDGRPVEELKQDMDLLLKEYLASRELDEAARCVKELDARHFHHELVKRGVVCAMEMDGGKQVLVESNHDPVSESEEELSNLDAMAALFGFLVRNAIVSENQVQKGLVRLHQLLDDIKLDIPSAPKLLVSFEKMVTQQGCLPKSGPTSSELANTNRMATVHT